MADGKITVEVSTQAVQAELERLRHENARLAREAHTWWTACAGATEELERLRDAIGRHPPSERQGLTDEQIASAVADERERCAVVADGASKAPNAGDDFANGWCSAAIQIAQAIRLSRHISIVPATPESAG